MEECLHSAISQNIKPHTKNLIRFFFKKLEEDEDGTKKDQISPSPSIRNILATEELTGEDKILLISAESLNQT